MKLWSLDGKLIQTFAGHRHFVWDVAFSPNGRSLASGSWDNTVILWRLDGTKIRTLNNPMPSARGENRLVSVVHRNKSGQFTTQPQHKLKGHEDNIWDVAFSSDGNMLVTASEDTTIKLWSLDGNLLRTFKGHSDRVNAITFIPPTLASLPPGARSSPPPVGTKPSNGNWMAHCSPLWKDVNYPTLPDSEDGALSQISPIGKRDSCPSS